MAVTQFVSNFLTLADNDSENKTTPLTSHVRNPNTRKKKHIFFQMVAFVQRSE